MAFLELLATAKKIYDTYGFIENTLTDHMAVMMRNIAQKEMESAIKTLADSKISNNKEREFASAVTQLRLALEKTDEELIKAKIAAVISFCYSVLNEARLSRSFEADSINFFNSYYDRELNAIVQGANIANGLSFAFTGPLGGARGGALGALIPQYNDLLNETKAFGFDVAETKIDVGGGVLMLLPFRKTDVGERATRLVQSVKQQYAKRVRDSLQKAS
jgi:hypothetical protein